MNPYFDQLILTEDKRLCVSEKLFSYFNVDPIMLRTLLFKHLRENLTQWKFFSRSGTRWIYYDTIPIEFKEKFGLVSDEVLLANEELRKKLDPELSDKTRLSILELTLLVQHKNFLTSKEGGDLFVEYFEQGFDSSMILKIVSTIAIENIMKEQEDSYTTRELFLALKKLITTKSISPPLFPVDDSKYFYELITKLKKFGIRHYLDKQRKKTEWGYLQKNKSVASLVSGLQMHGAILPDEQVKLIANTIITALPGIYGTKLLSRQMINRNRNGDNKTNINVGRFGGEFVKQVLSNDLTLAPTQFPLDRVEVDWTRLNIRFKDDLKRVVTFVICCIIDAKTSCILGWCVSKSATYESFRKAFRMMLVKTRNRLPRHIIGDLDPSFRSHEFKVRKELIEGLNIKVTNTPEPQGKPIVESCFATLVKKYLPIESGFTGSNKNNAGKRRKIRSDIELTLNNSEYLRSSDQAETLFGRIVHKHNNNNSNQLFSPNSNYHEFEHSNAVTIPDNVAAFLCYEFKQPLFNQNGVKFNSELHKYSYVLNIEDKKKHVEILSQLHGHYVDCYYDSESDSKAFIFRENSSEFLFELPLSERAYGNYADQMVDSSRVVQLKELISQKNQLTKELRKQAREILIQIRIDTGIPLKELVKLLYDDKQVGDDHAKLLANLTYPEQEYDPYTPSQPVRKPAFKAGKNRITKNKKILNINSSAA